METKTMATETATATEQPVKELVDCRWCDDSGRYRLQASNRWRSAAKRSAANEADPDFRVCTHPEPVTIRALPGATFRTTKFEVAKGAGRAYPAKPSWTAPRDVGKAFAKAILRPVPTPEEVT